ncbi:MAG: sigma-70 family RNA polymerase sigma factor [Ruminococcus sp.]|nr:sigma-70 family RNA polymerase sigma factor [Ruminococcus sp.]
MALIQQGNNQYCEQLYEQNRGLILKYAKKFSAYAELDELMQEGYIALMKAVNGFDTSKEYKFSTYLTKVLTSCLSRYCASCQSSVHIPPNLLSQVSELQRVRYEYIKRYEQEPTRRDYMVLMGLTKAQVDNLLRAMQAMDVLSLDKPLDDEGDSDYIELLADEANIEDEICDRSEAEYIRKTVHECVDSLPDTQGDIIRKRYFKRMTRAQIADMNGCTSSYVCETERKAKNALMKNKQMRDLYNSCYESRSAYHYSMERFKNTGMSATEYIAQKELERKQRLDSVRESMSNLMK